MKNKQDFRVGDKVIDILTDRIGVIKYITDYNSSIKRGFINIKFENSEGIFRIFNNPDKKRPTILHYRDDYDYNIIDFNNLPQRQEPKRWKAEKGENYYCMGKECDINSTDIFYACCVEYENDDDFDISNYNKGNYFQTEEQAKEVTDKMNAFFKEITSK